MSILSPFLPKKETTNFFIVIGLEENHVRAAVAQMLGDKVKILGVGKSEFSDESKETEAVDIAVSMAEKQISEDTLVENVIFALPQFYLEGDNVKPEYLIRLKKIARELDLKAYGFVEYATAVTNYLTTVEGSAPTVILLDLSKSHLTTTLVRIGKIIKNITTARSDSLVADFSKSLPEFEAEILPSRIIIFDIAQKTDDIREELLKFPWHKHSIFLHTPKMEVFDNEKILKAVVEAAASSFLPNISGTISETEDIDQINEEVKKEVIKEEVVEINEEKAHTGKKNSFGFTEETLLENRHEVQRETSSVTNEVTQNIANVKNAFSGFFGKFNPDKMKSFIPSGLPQIPMRGIFLVFPVIAVVLLFFFLLRNYPTATIYLVTYPAKSDAAIDVVFAKEGSSGDGNSIVTKTISEEATGSKNAKTTGTNQIGEKAKGEVTVYNKQTNSKNLPKGTVIASGPLRFTLDDEVKIASASESTEGITFGKTSVKVSAAQIGPESNLASNTNFTFPESAFSTLSAKNNLPFSGGTSREIDAVSKEDRDNLENDLIKELVNQAKQKMMKKLDVRGKLLDEPITTVVSAKKFSHEVGTEAKDLSLDMTLKVEGLEYNQADLEGKVQGASTSAPSGYKLDPTRVNVKVTSTRTTKSGDIEAKAIISSYFIPDLDLAKIKEEIKGKSFNDTTDILSKHGEIGGVRIVPENKLPFLNNSLPYLSKNISLIVTSK